MTFSNLTGGRPVMPMEEDQFDFGNDQDQDQEDPITGTSAWDTSCSATLLRSQTRLQSQSCTFDEDDVGMGMRASAEMDMNMNMNNTMLEEDYHSFGLPTLLCQRNKPLGFLDTPFATSVLDRFPMKDYKGVPLPEEELPMFCYPTGCKLFRARYQDAPLPEYYGFVVKNERGDIIHGTHIFVLSCMVYPLKSNLHPFL